MKLLSFGEVIWDIYPDRQCLGGAPLNFAAHSARHGVDVAMLSAVGADTLGEQALAQLREWGIGTDAVKVLPDKPTGTCQVTLDEAFVPHYHLCEDTAWDFIPCDIETDADVLYFGTLALRSDYNLAGMKNLLAKRSFRHVFVDVNIRAPFYSAEIVRFAFENATLLKISDEELPIVCGLLEMERTDCFETLLKTFCRQFPQLQLVVLTCGEKGACAYDATDNRFYQIGAVSTTAVSTVGAGDSFAAAFLAYYDRGESLETCLGHAASVAAYVVSRYEAVPPYNVADFA